jgi:hypothetical protein
VYGFSPQPSCLISAFARADLPGQPPYYLNALTDLRAPRWMLQHRPGDAAVSANEDGAITEINKAIGAIKHAAIDDGKKHRGPHERGHPAR